MENEEVCYTREIALEKAIEMEMNSFQTYKKAYMKIREPRVKNLVKDLALEELEHKYILEKAYFEETVALHEEGMKEGLSMKLSLLLKEKPLEDDADDQDVMIHAIHDEKRSVDYYKKWPSSVVVLQWRRCLKDCTRMKRHISFDWKSYTKVFI
jgi:rubrerythrin